MVRKLCELKRSIPNLFQFIVQVSLSQFPRALTTIAPILFVVFVIVFALQFSSNLSKKQSFGATNEEFSL